MDFRHAIPKQRVQNNKKNGKNMQVTQLICFENILNAYLITRSGIKKSNPK